MGWWRFLLGGLDDVSTARMTLSSHGERAAAIPPNPIPSESNRLHSTTQSQSVPANLRGFAPLQPPPFRLDKQENQNQEDADQPLGALDRHDVSLYDPLSSQLDVFLIRWRLSYTYFDVRLA